MLPAEIERNDFGVKLNHLVSPAKPIQSVEQLQGRTKELARIEKALFAEGRHIFIYGDRGVGKSSLAAAAANQCQSSDASYIDVSCSPDATYKSIVANIGYQAINASRLRKTKVTKSIGIEFRFLKAGASSETSLHDLHSEIHTLADAGEVLREVAAIHSERPIVVLDEFDRLSNDADKVAFSDLVKYVGDKKIGITFFFTGVGKTLEKLLVGHPSAIRQFETIELLKLSWDARWDIARKAANAFEVELDEQVCVRIAAVSDGYPYYVHLLTEKLLWRVYEAPTVIATIEREHYVGALQDAIESINAELRRPYELAVHHRSDDFEEVFWATADSDYLDRTLDDIFTSYQYVMKQRDPFSTRTMDSAGFRAIMQKLKSKSCGEVLVPSRFNRRGWYSYHEPVLRGYVRMQAEAHGIELIGETPAQKELRRVSTRTGNYGPSVPRGVHTGRRR